MTVFLCLQVNKETEVDVEDSTADLTDHLNRTIDSHFSKTLDDTRLGGVGASYTISKEDKESARERGLPVIPLTPAPADPQKIKVQLLDLTSFKVVLYNTIIIPPEIGVWKFRRI